jgi:hypothetical protein
MIQDAMYLQSPSLGIIHRLKLARRFVRWWPLATGVVALVLHIIIELNFVSYWPYPQEHSPLVIGLGFRALSWATLFLALFIFPRWQSFIALLILGYVILSLGGR